MKRFLLVPVFALLISSLFAQGEIKNASYLTLAWNRPMLNFGEQLDRNSAENLYKFYNNQYDNFAHYGGSLNFGTSFYIHPTGFIKGFKAGVLVDFIDLGANYMTFTDSSIQVATPTNFKEERVCHDLTGRYSLNIGALVTYSPKKKLFFDLYFKIRPTFAINYISAPLWKQVNSDVMYNDRIYTNYDQQTIYDASGKEIMHKQVFDETSIGLGLNYSYGLDIRYSKMSIGAELVTGKLKYTSSVIQLDQIVRDQYFKLKLGFFFAE